jgi:hypothetical protein
MSFTIILNSVNGTKIVNTTNNQVSYNFDFSIPTDYKGKYKLGYSFLSEGGMTLTSSDILYISTNLPVSMNNYLAGMNTEASKTQILGFINNEINSTDCYYYKNYLDTSPIIIEQIPSNFQSFTISLYNALTGELDTKILLKQYSLILYFEAI